MNPYPKASDQYITQRVLGASPEQLVALLLEGGQRFLAQAIQAMSRKDFAAKGQALNRVSAIIEELTLRLDHEGGGELVENLMGLYDWWVREIIDAGAQLEASRLERVSRQMGEMRQSWEQAYQARMGTVGNVQFQTGGMVG